MATPQAFHALIIDLPARITKKSCNATITITPVLPSQFNHISDKPFFIISAPGNMALR